MMNVMVDFGAVQWAALQTSGLDTQQYKLSLKNAWLPPIFFLDFNRTC